MNKMRGIRLRKENIQIGDENTLGASPKFSRNLEEIAILLAKFML